ncbi:Acetyltransferase [Phaeobacter inhibens]|uniref:Acetyltransferase n=1 Tax=Phaeobacter inhibens TaxID=221822 RepID=A0A2I7JZZ8_9RHOB|nr:GNAT family N-acetyltransferase [Phaeobacter inhibens]AUQ51413.1 Acetyltransferase [Phaeobacter inhibens]AUQ95932.1 Acetyltransferase [Phaeobacter inhibens]AUQ97569.1 Acetyltransferase [Phaeobacter inhibens]AUR21218.1 Acetyltransferase [Phaeobacter inhibens]
MGLRLESLRGAALAQVLDDVARLRITVFRDWPYLYDGDLAYERSYLQSYLDSDRSVVVGAWDGERLVGASTGAPLIDHAEDFAAAFEGTGLALKDVFYCAESVLLPEYRGMGLGHRFFDLREAHARNLGYVVSAFCSVQRPDNHPSRPPYYRDLNGFWRKRGYAPIPGAVARFSWRDVGDAEETRKPLQFWSRLLT